MIQCQRPRYEHYAGERRKEAPKKSSLLFGFAVQYRVYGERGGYITVPPRS
jgi:hypothetical protein